MNKNRKENHEQPKQKKNLMFLNELSWKKMKNFFFIHCTKCISTLFSHTHAHSQHGLYVAIEI